MSHRSRLHLLMAALVALAVLASGCSATEDPAPAAPSPTPPGPALVTVAVYGPPTVISAYEEIAARYSVDHPDTKVNIKGYASHDEASKALEESTAAGDPPDLFLIDHDDLPALSAQDAVRRVDDLLAAREIDFGDGYSRVGLEAFSSEASLQCMPADISPLVVYYNPELIDLAQVAELGRNPVTQKTGWSLEEFGRAALQARRPGVRGLYVAPELEQVAPFIWSGGGEVVDDQEEPTTLTLAEDASAESMRKLLELVRNPALTFGEKALRKRPALERFKAGELGMILGYRDLTPVLRRELDLTFDVMPLPKISRAATVAQMSGLCLSSASWEPEKTADFLAALISDAGASTLAATGYTMPANLDVVNSDAFLQSGQRPLSGEVFARRLRDSRALPSTQAWPSVSRAAARQLTELFYEPGFVPLPDRLESIDESSVALFAPPATPGASPSASPNQD